MTLEGEIFLRAARTKKMVRHIRRRQKRATCQRIASTRTKLSELESFTDNPIGNGRSRFNQGLTFRVNPQLKLLYKYFSLDLHSSSPSCIPSCLWKLC